MSTPLPDDQLPPLPPDTGVSSDQSQLPPDLTSTPTPIAPAVPVANIAPPPTTTPSLSTAQPLPQSINLEPSIAPPTPQEIPHEANFPGQPLPDSEQDKLEKKAEDIVGVTSEAKAKKTGKIMKAVLGALTLLVLGGGVMVGTNLVQLPGVGDLRQQAGLNDSCYDDCRENKGHLVCMCNCGGDCYRDDTVPDNDNDPSTPFATPRPAVDPNPNDCEFECGGCGGFCGDAGVAAGKTCNQQIAERQAAGNCEGDGVQYGANFVPKPASGVCPAGYTSASCTCGGADYCFSRGFESQCDTPQGLCAVVSSPGNQPGGSGSPAGTTNIYLCEGQFNMANGCQGQTATSIPGCFCGTIQVDTVGGGFTSYEEYCGCEEEPPEETPPSETLACVGLSSVPTSPELGDSVRYTCEGTASPGSVHHYDFQYKIGSGEFTALAEETVGSGQSAPLVISEPGSYTVRCRACKSTDGSNCSAYHSL